MVFGSELVLGVLLAVVNGLSLVMVGAFVGGAERHRISNQMMVLVLSTMSLVFCGGLVCCGAVSELPARQRLFFGSCYLLFGAFNAAMLVVMGRAMRKGPNAIVWGGTQSGMILPFLCGVIFFGNALTVWRLCGMAAILGALALYVCTKNDVAADKRDGAAGGLNWRLLMFFSFLLCGINQICNNLPSYYADARQAFTISERIVWGNLGQLLCCLAIGGREPWRRRFWKDLRRPVCWKYILVWWLVSLFVTYFISYRSMDLLGAAGAGAICYPVTVCACIVGFTLYSVAVLREKCTPTILGAIGLGLLGMVLISW